MTQSEPLAPIAVVGLGCVLPDASSPEKFWANVLSGHCALRPLAGGRWEWDRLGLPRLPPAARVEGFTPDWRAFRMPPADAAAMNPAQLQVLEAGRQALSEVREVPRERTGIWLGATGLGWQPDTGLRVRLDELVSAAQDAARVAGVSAEASAAALSAARRALEARLLPASEEPVVNSAASIAAGRVAILLDLRGPHCAVDAGFASGLAALDLAARALRDGTVDCALVGAASELLSPAELVAMARMGVLASDRVRPFDADANGTLLGEGAVLLAVKRLEDAVRDGDRIHAVVLGVGAACDGAAASLLAPRPDGLALAIRRAHAQAAVEPATIGFVECHATGTPRGDATELRALAEAYGGAPGPVALGSAKPLVGHLRGASAAVGLLRAILALEHGRVPAQPGFSRPHPDLQLEGSPFVVPTETRPLAPLGGAEVARAGVTALSLCGIAYHAVLEAPPRPGRSKPRPARRPPAPEPIAVVGLGGVFPGADDVPAFWASLLDGRHSVREVPPERWDASRYCADASRLERSYTRLGCFVEQGGTLDPRWRIPPASLHAIDPGHLLVLRAAEEAISDAHLDSTAWDRAQTGVFLGFMACQGRKLLAEIRFHFARLAAELDPSLREQGVDPSSVRLLLADAARRIEAGLPPLGEDSLTGWLGSVAAARVARRFDLRGPQLAIESACASTLAALQAALQALRDGTCDTALAGGVWADMQPEFYVGSCRFNALSPSGSTPFDARANGFVPGEGAGLLVLRRLADAERDGQRIHALVRSMGGSSDGRGKSVFAPSADGEALAMTRALEHARLDPGLVDYVECHGTGTALGDKTEVEACLLAYGRARRRPLRLGSVKSNVGHLLAGAAAPALVKAVLSVREGTIPPSLHVTTPNPAIDFAAGPIEVVTRASVWEGPPGEPRRAGVSAFGLGGTNYHAIIEEYRPPLAVHPSSGGRRPGDASSRSETAPPLPIAAAGGRDVAACLEHLTKLATRLRGASGSSYLDALRPGQHTAGGAPYRVGIVAPDASTLEAKVGLLARALSGGIDLALLQSRGVYAAAHAPALRVAATFPGQGPQYPNMLRDALAAFPSLGITLGAADRAYEELCGRPLRGAFFTDDPGGYSQNDEDIHAAVFVVNVALYRLLTRHGLAPHALMGQSAGELAALVAAGAMSFEDGLAVVRERTLSVLALTGDDPGRMVALACGAERAEDLLARLPGYAALAADNGPEACIVSGDQRAVAELLRRAAHEGIEANALAVSHGYHSQLIAAARPRYLRLLRTIAFRPPEIEVISTVTGRSLAAVPPERLADHLASQFVEPVRLRPAVEALHAGGVRLFVECGPKWPLTTFVPQILRGRPHVAHATLHPKVGEVEQLHRALACLFTHGVAGLVPKEDSTMSDTKKPMRIPEIQPGSGATALAPAMPRAPDADLVELLRVIRGAIDTFLGQAEPRSPGLPPREDRSGPPAPWRETQPTIPARPAGAIALGRESPAVPQVPLPVVHVAQAPDLADVREEIRRALLEEYVRRTGYPEEMLDPELDLEADLGIDTVKQVAVLAAVRERVGLAPDPGFKLRDASTIAKAVAWFAGRLARTASPATRPPPVRTATRVESAAPAAPAIDAARERVRRALVEELVRRTGYPEEMLDPELDLEAELGIDTVKQVAVLAAVRERFGLTPDPSLKLRNANTIDKAVELLAQRLTAEPPGPRDPPGGPRPPPGGGSPRPLAPPPSVDAGPPAPARAAGPAAHASRRMLEAVLGAAPGDVIEEITGLTLHVSGDEPQAREPLVDVTEEADGAYRLRAVLGVDVTEAIVRTGAAASAPPAPPEIVRAIAPERRGRAASGDELRELLAPVLGQAEGLLQWARSDGFMVAVGGAVSPDGDDVHRLAAVLASAGEVASFAWVGLTGAPHAVCAIERARIHAVPAAGADVSVHAKMVAPEGGLWRADVTVVSGDRLMAEIRGLTGRPFARSAASGPAGAAAERAWQRFCRRMQGERAHEGVA